MKLGHMCGSRRCLHSCSALPNLCLIIGCDGIGVKVLSERKYRFRSHVWGSLRDSKTFWVTWAFSFLFLLLLLVYHENGSHVWKQEVSPLMQCVDNKLSFRINDARNHIQSRKQFSW